MPHGIVAPGGMGRWLDHFCEEPESVTGAAGVM
jgi:hypothetical protein